eukprot:365810-Chlamydomonas_euryale.AAC.42
MQRRSAGSSGRSTPSSSGSDGASGSAARAYAHAGGGTSERQTQLRARLAHHLVSLHRTCHNKHGGRPLNSGPSPGLPPVFASIPNATYPRYRDPRNRDPRIRDPRKRGPRKRDPAEQLRRATI